MFAHNVNGLLTKIHDFYTAVNAATFDIYMLTETNLNDSIFSCNLFPPNNFDVYRCDRSRNTSLKQSGGGVLIGVKKKFKSELIVCAAPDGCEQIWVQIKNRNKKILIGTLYIPPDSCSVTYNRHMLITKKICEGADKDTTIVLFGDFNLPSLEWIQSDIQENSYIPINVSNQSEEIVINTCCELGMFQMNYVLNDNDRILDLLWINEPDLCICQMCVNNILYNEVHHKALKIELDIQISTSSESKQFFMDFNNADYNKINRELDSVNWNDVFANKNGLNSKVKEFYEILNKIINENVKRKEMKKTRHPLWYDKSAINMTNRLNRMNKKFHKLNSAEIHDQYAQLKSSLAVHTRKLYSDYKINMQQMISDDPQQFFKHVNLNKKNCDDLPTTMSLNDKIAENSNDVADLFRQFFQSIYTTPDNECMRKFNDYYRINNHLQYLQNVCQHVPNVEFGESDIYKCIAAIPSNMVMGPDNIPNVFVKKCIESLTKPIFTLLSESFSSQNVPDLWKKSYIRPIFKSGKKSNVENYRGVAVQCTIAKILDSIIAKHLNRYLKNILTHHQHGFIAGKSTVTNLAEYTFALNNALSTHKQTDSIYLDLCKAFDSVTIVLLFHKLRIMGLDQRIVKWIEEYFCGRQQLVRIGYETISDPINVTSGVGQGYPISSALFNLFLYDLPFFVKTASISLFADDAKLYLPINNVEDCKILQNEMESVNEYFNINCMKLNEKKTKTISFYKCRSPIEFNYILNESLIERANTIKDLGILLDNKLSYKSHINYVIGKAKSILGWIKRYSYEFDDPWIIKRLFETFVLPILEYASHIWSPTAQVDCIRIESLQKQFLLYALRKFGWADRFDLPSYRDRLLYFHMNTLEDRRRIYQIIFIFALLKGYVSSPNLLLNVNIRMPQRTARNFLAHGDDTNNYMSPFILMKVQFNSIFALRNSENEFIFDFNQSIDVIRKNLKQYLKLNYVNNEKT